MKKIEPLNLAPTIQPKAEIRKPYAVPQLVLQGEFERITAGSGATFSE